jgi:hypothetical protein
LRGTAHPGFNSIVGICRQELNHDWRSSPINPAGTRYFGRATGDSFMASDQPRQFSLFSEQCACCNGQRPALCRIPFPPLNSSCRSTPANFFTYVTRPIQPQLVPTGARSHRAEPNQQTSSEPSEHEPNSLRKFNNSCIRSLDALFPEMHTPRGSGSTHLRFGSTLTGLQSVLRGTGSSSAGQMLGSAARNNQHSTARDVSTRLSRLLDRYQRRYDARGPD